MIKLIHPTAEYSNSIMKMRREFLEKDHENYIHGSANLQDYDTAQEWLTNVNNMQHRETCPKDLVDSDIYLAVREEDNKLVGIAELRHNINHPILSSWGGHIGYSVRPTERRKGYGITILRLILVECQKLGIKDVLLTCRENNLASERTILNNGGVYENSVWAEELKVNMKRFWI